MFAALRHGDCLLPLRQRWDPVSDLRGMVLNQEAYRGLTRPVIRLRRFPSGYVVDQVTLNAGDDFCREFPND